MPPSRSPRLHTGPQGLLLVLLMCAAVTGTFLQSPVNAPADPGPGTDPTVQADPSLTMPWTRPASADIARRATPLSESATGSSFVIGDGEWRVRGPHASVRVNPPGVRRGVVLRSTRPTKATLRQSRPSEPLARATRAIGAAASIRNLGPSTRLMLAVQRSAATGRVTIASREVVVPRGATRRVRLARPVGVARGTRLSVVLTAPRMPGNASVVVDDVRVTTTNAAGSGRWSSGASGSGAAGGAFGAWRGTPTTIAATWNDSFEAQTNQWTVQPGAEYGAWTGDLDVAIGGIYRAQGDTWAKAANGAYDDRWRTALTTLATAWTGRPGTLYVRFAHEFNGEWEPWSVRGDQTADFIASWRRLRALQLQILPAAQLVFSPTSDTSASLGLDWRKAFPGADAVDVLSVDYYNQYPFLAKPQAFRDSLDNVDATGAPRGLEAYREFAAARGVQFAISEWSSNADQGDSPAFVTGLHDWVSDHAGSGAGQVLYEITFNVAEFDNGQFELFPTTRQPAAAAAYRALW